MKKNVLSEKVQQMQNTKKPKITRPALAGFIAGGTVVAAAATAIGYFFLRKKEITLRLCCDINDHGDDECRFEEECDCQEKPATAEPSACGDEDAAEETPCCEACGEENAE